MEVRVALILSSIVMRMCIFRWLKRFVGNLHRLLLTGRRRLVDK